MKFLQFLSTFMLGIFGLSLGGFTQSNIYHSRCEKMYSDMPANKVVEHCDKILKFEKESK